MRFWSVNVKTLSSPAEVAAADLHSDVVIISSLFSVRVCVCVCVCVCAVV